ncbi:hypothetical protein SAMN05421690_10763 [Nitrosomonas sp. Nm51]|uniref:hypothetical protein n=1 Tax=Nitrosomonas sp. Nm51 TaxID=133720 RepID=UPI0008D5CDA9|nr:hypothetical protein [Nitrosomonas sp. Nm51]SER78413.1 hypothetical protein SAMN05421690_10763 [Nitrosomonas sp. Nm51]
MNEPVAIEFSEEGDAAKINYSIPMPGAHTGRRVMEVELDLEDEPFTPDSFRFGIELGAAIGVSPDDGNIINENIAANFFSEQLKKAGVSVVAPNLLANASHISGLQVKHATTTSRPTNEAAALSVDRNALPLVRSSVKSKVNDGQIAALYTDFISDWRNGIVHIPVVDWAGSITTLPRPTHPDPKPRFFIIERYGISSFLGDYGMGRTVKTFTLLPGESTTISLKTWQSTKESVEQSSSIIDSHEQSARERFAEQVQNETTDKATKSKTEEWHVEAEAKASWGFGSAKVSGGGSGEYHSGREQFARQATEATTEHAAEASSKRELSVSSSSEKTTESGSESLIERTITNVNVRRVLNFVFRELNQAFITKLHLKNIHVGFTNGLYNSWREVPLSGLRTLLKETLRPDQIDGAAQQILRVAGTIFDQDDTAVQVLDKVTINQNGDGVTVEPAARDGNGDFAPPTDDMYYRFRPGPLNQGGQSNPVDGVLLSETQITMRTDSVIVEALLGQSDSLDAYAMEIQQAAAEKDTLANRREKMIQETLEAIDDPERRAELAARLLGTCCPEKE